MKTEVCITVDLEFTIGGAFNDPFNKQPVGERCVRCNIDGKSHGLGFLLNTFAKYGIQATFFVEVFNTAFFGDEPMRTLAHEILDAGHDIQLHLHPCWLHFQTPDWRANLDSIPPNDSLANRSLKELEEIIGLGLEIFRRWNIPAPVAIRSGSLHADSTLYRAIHNVGLPLSSNIGFAIYQPTEPQLHLYSGRHMIQGVIEMPVLTYTDIRFSERTHYKTLTITGSSWEETREILQRARQKNVSHVVLLTHASEFVKRGDEQYRGIIPNNINQQRLINLCRFLSENRESFTNTTFSESARHCQTTQSPDNYLLEVSPWSTVKRIVENKLNDTFSWL